MKNIYFICLILLALPVLINAQMPGTGKYGNEWINYDQPYFKIPVAQDGIYRITYENLTQAGFPVNSVQALQLQMYHLGEQIPIYITTDGNLSSTDYIEFYGKKNRGELDRFLYKNGEADMLNPEYSMFTDTAAYYLTIAPAQNETEVRYRTIENDLTNLPLPEEWFWEEVLKAYQNSAVQPVIGQYTDSNFDKGEGFAWLRNLNEVVKEDLPTKFRFLSGSNNNDSLEVRMVGTGTNSHKISVKANDQQLEEWTDNGNQLWSKIYSLLASGDKVSISIANQTGRFAIAYLRLKYRRNFNFDKQTFRYFRLLPAATSRYLEIENFDSGGTAPTLYDITNQIRIPTLLEGGKVKVRIPASGKPQELVLSSVSKGFRIVDSITPVNFQNLTQEPTYIIISSRKLRNDGQGNDPVKEYASYRASTAGGSFDTLIVNVEDLYEQFAYGIQRHPLAIRNFAHFIKNRQEAIPYFFLIGKGREYPATRTASKLAGNSSYFIPTFGSPGSDNLLLATNENIVPAFPVGRLSAAIPEDIKLYLNKIKQHEDQSLTETEDRIWKKHILHFGGGDNLGEQTAIKNNLASMEREIKSNNWGADVNSFFKTSADPIQKAQSELIQERINQGVAMMVFFGHASANSFDINTDDPSVYRNFRRYPLVVSLGCQSGQIHENFRSIGEDFVLQQEKGAIAFMATTSYGEISALNTLYNEFYKQQGGAYYQQSIGKALNVSFLKFANQNGISLRVLLQQFTLNGDPAVTITPGAFADYLPDRTSINLTPSAVNAQQDSMEVAFTILNAGKNQREKLLVEVERAFPNELRVPVFSQSIDPPAYATAMKIKFPVFGEQAAGFNRLFIKLNSNKKIQESPLPAAEANNNLKNALNQEGAEFFVYSNSIVPIYPAPFSIIGNPLVRFQASTTNTFDRNRQVFFELDTTAQFKSPLRQTINPSFGGVIEWSPILALQDSTVYYWRVAIADRQLKDTVWNTSSFLYVSGAQQGWNQSHFFQFQENRSNNFKWDEERRTLKYIDNVKGMQVKNLRLGLIPGILPTVTIDNNSFGYIPWDGEVNNGIYVTVLDSVTVDYWLNAYPGSFGSRLPHPWAIGAKSVAHFPYYTTTPEWRARAIRFLRDSIPNGNYVLIYTVQSDSDSLGYHPQEWAIDDPQLGTSLLKILEAEGVTLFQNTLQQGAKPYVLLYKKGERLIDEALAAHRDSILIKSFAVPGRWDSGTITTTNIGPAKRWNHFYWDYNSQEIQDQLKLSIYGIRLDSTQILLFDNVLEPDVDLTTIDAREFPYLQLQYYTKDSILLSSPQLRFWRILYEGLPDAALHPEAAFNFQSDTISQGQPLQLELAISNLGDSDMDSLTVTYTLTSANGNVQQKQDHLGKLAQQNTILTKLQYDNTKTLEEGKNQLKIEANPSNNPAEIHRFNNIGFLDFWVEKDRRNPLMDITFDGVRILNGDIISAKPTIVISLRDENTYIPLASPELFSIYLDGPNPTNPNATITKKIDLDNEQIQFTSAMEPGKQNQASIIWTPDFNQSGIYTLRVQAKDATGNATGSDDYKINFEVITESLISNVFNYPNPFSTSTQFVYTLTGAEPPSRYQIQILTISGRIVRELTEFDLGPLRIGTHRTELPWDGTDQYGDRLANGIYLYRVIVKDQEGKDYEKFDNETDRFFKNKIGKLVILR